MISCRNTITATGPWVINLNLVGVPQTSDCKICLKGYLHVRIMKVPFFISNNHTNFTQLFDISATIPHYN